MERKDRLKKYGILISESNKFFFYLLQCESDCITSLRKSSFRFTRVWSSVLPDLADVHFIFSRYISIVFD